MAFSGVPQLTFDDWNDDQTDEGFEPGDCSSSGGGDDDFGLTPLQLLKRYSDEDDCYEVVRNSSRPKLPNAVLDMFRTAPADVLSNELPDIMRLFANLKNVTFLQQILDRLPEIAQQAFENSERVPALKDVIGDCLLPLVLRNLGSAESVGQTAERALVQMIEKGLVSKVLAEIKICPEVLALTKISQDSGNAEVNIGVATKIMSKLAYLLGKDITERILLPRFIELCSSHTFYIRKFATSNFGYYCAVIGKEAFEGKLLPLYLSLCQDETWGVRKSCASVVAYVSCVCPKDLRRALLAVAFSKLLGDECRWVRMAAFETLGTFIVTFADPALVDVEYDAASGELVLFDRRGSNFYNARGECLDKKWQSAWLYRSHVPMFDPSVEVTDLDENRRPPELDYGGFSKSLEYFLNNGQENVNRRQEDAPVDKHEDDLLSYNEFNYWHISPAETGLDLEGFVDFPRPVGTDKTTTVIPLPPKGEDDGADLNTSGPTPRDNKSDIDDNNKPGDESMVEEENAPRVKEEEVTEFVEPPQKIVPQDLLDHFNSMVNPEKFSDGEMFVNCAYVLPAVAVTLGGENWLLLKETTDKLAMHMSYKIRKTVASSLHDLAPILGPGLTAEHLLPLFEGFLRDVDEVRGAVLRHLHDFLRLLDPERRVAFLPKMADFLRVENPCNWRFQETLAEQLAECVPLFSSKDVVKHIGACAQALLLHNVAAVRRAAILLITRIVKHILNDDMLLSNYILMMCQRFALSKKWRARQSFAMFCSEMLDRRVMRLEQFVALLMPQLLDLSWDPVANVRMIVGDCITKHLILSDDRAAANLPTETLEWLTPVLRKLQTDKDDDVRYFASHH